MKPHKTIRDAIHEDIEVKRALLWNYMAEIIERNKESVIVVKYEDFVQNPNLEVKKIFKKFPEFQFDLPKSNLRSSKNTLSKEEVEKIKNICKKPALKFGYNI